MEKSTITPALVSCLVATQFPHWAHLPIRQVELDGWDNATFRLGETMSVRLPSADAYVPQVEKEHRWLPVLAPRLPLAIPEPLARGEPGAVFPRPWSVYRWLKGEHATVEHIADLERFAGDLAGFLAALRRIDTTDGPVAGEHSFFRGGPLATYDEETREAIAASTEWLDTDRATVAWEEALASRWLERPVWVHGDVTASNLLVVDGCLRAVVDFGCSAVGDPACDLAIAWTLFHGRSRRTFRELLGLDEGTRARGRGWALWKALITLARPSPSAADLPAHRFGRRLDARGVIEEILAERALAKDRSRRSA